MYNPIPVTERVVKLRNAYKDYLSRSDAWHKYYSEDRRIGLGFLRGWYENDRALTTLMRRSLAEAAELDSSNPVIDDGELIVGKRDFRELQPAEKEELDRLFNMFHMSPSSFRSEEVRPRGDHIALDYEKLLKVGINGLLAEIKQKKSLIEKASIDNLYDISNAEKTEYYDCCIIELEAVLRLALRYSDEALRLAETASEPRKSELLEISRIMRRVPANPAESFYEAVESVHFYIFNMFGLYPLGRPDRYLLPFYEHDIKSGLISRERAQELIDSLCSLVSTYVFSRSASGFVVGGTDSEGRLVENELSYMFLTALDHIRLADPNGAIAVNSQTSDEILDYACRILGNGVTHPALYNDSLIQESLQDYGVSKEDSVDFIHTTCAEISAAGKSWMYTTSTIVNLPKILLDIIAKRQDYKNKDEIVSELISALKGIMSDANMKYVTAIMESARNGLQPIRSSCLIDDCIERGKSLYQGGARYSFLLPIFIGFSNLCDSLVAIDELVFRTERLSLKEFYDIVMDDYKGHEDLRRFIVNKLPHYGNDEKTADEMAADLGKHLVTMFKDPAVFGSKFCMPGTFSYKLHASRGKNTPATFDGRHANTSLSDGCCPVQGYDRNVPTALINSLTCWNQSSMLGGMVVNLKFSKSNFSEEKRSLLVQIIRAFMQRGGIEMQINVVDRATLEDAVIYPELHGDLLVRIGGFSDYFVRQSPVMQNEIIARTEL